MESDLFRPSATEAARILQEHGEAEERAARYRPSRSFARFQLWSALLIGVYLAVFLLTFGGRNDHGENPVGTYALPLMVYPVTIKGLLDRGVRERFGVRSKPSAGYWVACVIVGVGLATLLLLTMAEIAYPWWLNLLVPVVIFVAMAVSPLRQLRGAATVESERWRNMPLSTPARWTTACLGVALGTTVALSGQEWFGGFQVVMVAVLVAAVVGNESKWGLPRVGFEWGPLHWTAFGVTLGILFGLTSLLALTDLITTPVTVAAGVVIAAGMTLTALLPARRG